MQICVEIFWINNKTIMKCGFRMMSVENILLDLHNFSHPTQPHSIISKYFYRYLWKQILAANLVILVSEVFTWFKDTVIHCLLGQLKVRIQIFFKEPHFLTLIGLLSTRDHWIPWKSHSREWSNGPVQTNPHNKICDLQKILRFAWTTGGSYFQG